MADLVTLMEDIARAIRTRTGSDEKINAQNFPQAIRNIKIGEASDSRPDKLLVTEGKLLKSIFPPIDSILDWSRKITLPSFIREAAFFAIIFFASMLW